jgi:ATP-dependent HslUV protease subunit HslV
MGTIVAIRKNDEACIASDSLNLFEDIIQPSLSVADSCLMKVGDSFIGLNSSLSYQQAFEEVLSGIISKSSPQLDSPVHIKRFFCGIHDTLRANHQLVPSVVAGQPFENMPMNALVVNRAGIYKFDSNRSVYEFKKFWAIGSAAPFALGAMQVGYEHIQSASQLARAALEACAEFEANRGRQFYLHSIRVTALSVARSSGLSASSSKSRVTPLRKRGPRPK